MPKVSVIIPAYNAADHLHRTLDSIFNQTFRDFEVVVCDDGSTDNTVDVLKGYENRLRWTSQAHQGQASAVNRALSMAQGEYFAYFDADDIMLPMKLEVQARYLDEHPEVHVVYSADKYSSAWGLRTLRERSNPLDSFYLLQYCYILRTTVMHRRACLDEVGLFNGAVSGSDDWDMWVRMSERCRMDYIDQILSEYRIHGGNISRTRPKPLNHYRRVRMIIVGDACRRQGRPFWLRMMALSAKLSWLVGRLPIIGECSPWSVETRVQRFVEWLLLRWLATPPHPAEGQNLPIKHSSSANT